MAVVYCYLIYYSLMCILGTGGVTPTYRFGTKTSYETSIDNFIHLSSDKLNTLGSHRQSKFCSPVHLNALIRHGIRNIGRSDIIHFNSAVNKILTSLENQNHPLLKTLIKLKDDVVTFHEEKSLLPQGREEQKYLARRIFNTYPALLTNVDPEDVHLIVSSSQRTVDSCLAFMEEWLPEIDIDELKSQLHVNDTLIRFFDLCPKYVKEVDERRTISLHEYYKYQKDNFNRISQKINEKLNLKREKTLTKKEMKALFIMSAIEVATLKTSELLALFDEEEIKTLEYAIDLKSNLSEIPKIQKRHEAFNFGYVKSQSIYGMGQSVENYWKKSYGHEINYKQSCVLLADIFSDLEKAIQNKRHHKAVLHFGHAETLLPLLALLGLFRDEVELRAENQDVHADRNFRTSVLSPFSANVVFVLHRCDGHTENDLSWSKHMVQVRVNEVPVKIPGCEDEFCSYETLRKSYKEILDSCNFERMCSLHDHDEL